MHPCCPAARNGGFALAFAFALFDPLALLESLALFGTLALLGALIFLLFLYFTFKKIKGMPPAPSLESLLEKCAREPHELTVVEMPGARTHHFKGDALRDYFTTVVHASPMWNLTPMLSGLDPPDPSVPHVAAWSLKNETIEVYYDHRPGSDTAGIYIRRVSAASASFLELRVFQPPGTHDRLVQFIVPGATYAFHTADFQHPEHLGTPEISNDDLKAFQTGLTWLNQWFWMPHVAKKKLFQLQPTVYFIPERPTETEASRGMFFYTQPKSLVSSKKDPKVPLLNDWAARVYDLLQHPVPVANIRKPSAERRSPAKPRKASPKAPKKPASSSSVLLGSPVLDFVAPPEVVVPAPPKKEDKKKPVPEVVAPPKASPKAPSMRPVLELTKKAGQTQSTLFKGKATLAMIVGTYETKVACAVGGLSNCFIIESLATKRQAFSVSPRNTALYTLLNAVMDAKSGRVFQGVYLIPSLNLIVLETKKSTVPKARPEYAVFEVKKSGKDTNYSPQPNITVRKG